MEKLIGVVLAGLMLVGCGKETQTTSFKPTAQAVAPALVRTHNYSLKDGYEYGYERALTVDEANKGQAASSLVMARFVGQRDGKYQVYVKNEDAPGYVEVAECTNPCEFMKNMVFNQGEHVSTERLRVAPRVMGWLMLEDAINGQLEQYHLKSDGRKYSVWFDEQKGQINTLVNDNAPAKTL